MKSTEKRSDVREKKKQSEYRSLNAAKKDLIFLESLTDISMSGQERPDFVFVDTFGKKIGIEHFCIDISMGNRSVSSTKESQATTRKIYEKYHNDIKNRMEDAVFDIEKLLNQFMRDWQNFNYQTFCGNFRKKFNKHFSSVDEYKANFDLAKIGFLIEFLVPDGLYNVSLNGEPLHIQELHNFPITIEIWEILNKSLGKLDFIILDTNQSSKKKDYILFIEKGIEPIKIFKQFAPLFVGKKGKAKFELTH